MNLLGVFGSGPVIEAAPGDVRWRSIRPKKFQRPIRARRAEADCTVWSAHGRQRARGGRDYIVNHGDGDEAVVRGDIFARTYEPLGGGLFRKRTDVVLRAFILDRPVVIAT